MKIKFKLTLDYDIIECYELAATSIVEYNFLKFKLIFKEIDPVKIEVIQELHI